MQEKEINDVLHENEGEREYILESIRDQEKDLKYYTNLSKYLFNIDDLDLIKQNSEWNDESKEWKIPPFTYKEK